MTDTSDKIRSLVLAALMVMSVFAGSIAFSGAATADTDGNATVTDVSIGNGVTLNASEAASDEQTQEIDIEVNMDGGDEHEVEVDITEAQDAGLEIATLNDATSSNLDVTTSDEDDGVITLTIENTGDTAIEGENVDLNIAWDVSDAENNDQIRHIVTGLNDDSTERAAFKVTGEFSQVISDGDTSTTVFAGETVQFYAENLGTGTQIEILETDDDGNADGVADVVGNTDMSDRINYDTSGLDTGEDYIVDFSNDGSTNTVDVSVRDLGWNVSSTDSTFNEEERPSADVESNAASDEYEATLLDSSGDEVGDPIEDQLSGSGDATVRFPSGQDLGNYTIEVEHSATGISAETDEFEVVEAGDEDVSFEEAYMVDQVGDVASITLELDNTDSATIYIGDESEDGYELEADVEDDGDGVVTVEFNSYTAGTSGENEVVSVDTSDEDDSISGVSESGDFLEDASDTDASDALLAAHEYTVEAETETGGDALGTLALEERSTENMSIWTAPEGEDVSDYEAADFWDNEGSTVTESDEIAEQDYVVHAIEASGLEGIAENDGLLDSDEFDITVEESDDAVNRQPDSVDLDTGATVVEDSANDTYFLVLDLGQAQLDGEAIESGDSLEGNFSIVEDSVLEADGDNYAAGSYEITDREAELDTQDDTVFVQAGSDQEISGQTSIAPGSEVTVRVTSTDSQSPFRFSPSATVQSDGTFSANADFSDEDTGANFTVSVIDPYDNNAFGDADEVDGQISDEPPETDTPTPGEDETATPTDDGDETATATEDPGEDTPTPTETETGPGFGALVAVIAMLGAALLAARRNA